MDSIIQHGVVNPTYGASFNNSDTRPIREDISKFRFSDSDTISKGSGVFETTDLRVKIDALNFKKKKSNLDPNNAQTDLYTRSNVIYSDTKDLAKERKTAIYIKQRDDYNKVANDYRLDNKGFYEDNSRFKGSLGNFEAPKICPIRKIDFDYDGTKFLISVSGFKNIERREMTQLSVPLKRIMNSTHTPISTINNGTKSTRLIRY